MPYTHCLCCSRCELEHRMTLVTVEVPGTPTGKSRLCGPCARRLKREGVLSALVNGDRATIRPVEDEAARRYLRR